MLIKKDDACVCKKPYLKIGNRICINDVLVNTFPLV